MEDAQQTNQSSALTPKKSYTLLLVFGAIIIFLLGLFGGSMLKGSTYPTQTQITNHIIPTSPSAVSTTSPSLMPTSTASSADTVVQTYYQTYLSCLDKHFANPTTTGSPMQDCPYNQSNVLTPSLNDKLQQLQAFDPILCAQNVPLKITYEKAVINRTHAATNIYTHWGASPKQTIEIGSDFINNEWKISSITCPKP
jgi:hypothetical protein